MQSLVMSQSARKPWYDRFYQHLQLKVGFQAIEERYISAGILNGIWN